MTLTHLRLQASSPPSPSTRPPPVYRIPPRSRTLSSSSTQKPASPTLTPHPWRLPFETRREPHPVRPATSDQARHPDSTVSDGRDDSPSGQPAVGSSTEQAAPPPAGCGPRVSETSLKNGAVFGAAGLTGPRKAYQGNNQGRPLSDPRSRRWSVSLTVTRRPHRRKRKRKRTR